LALCDGDLEKAEKFRDTNVYYYYYQIVQKNKWIEKRNDQIKEEMNKNKAG
jgi:hypothetical protein